MVERARCPVCRTVVPVSMLRSVGERCPRCAQPLYEARRRPTPGGVLGKAITLVSAESVRESRSPRH